MTEMVGGGGGGGGELSRFNPLVLVFFGKETEKGGGRERNRSGERERGG